MKFPSTDHWLIKSLALAIIVPLPIGLLDYATAFSVGMHAGPALLLVYVLPPLWLIALVIVGRSALEGGWSEESKGELERLLKCKAILLLRPRPKIDEAAPPVPVALERPKPAPEPVDSGPVLDHLLDWKRKNHPTPADPGADDE
jgi:hypothetical protein